MAGVMTDADDYVHPVDAYNRVYTDRNKSTYDDKYVG